MARYTLTLTIEVTDQGQLLKAARELAGPTAGAARTAAQALGVVSDHAADFLARCELGCDVVGREVKAAGADDARLPDLARRLDALAEENRDVQFAVDDLIYDHCGTGKHWSNVNNQGIPTQAEALAERIGPDAAVQELQGLLDRFESPARDHDEHRRRRTPRRRS